MFKWIDYRQQSKEKLELCLRCTQREGVLARYIIEHIVTYETHWYSLYIYIVCATLVAHGLACTHFPCKLRGVHVVIFIMYQKIVLKLL